VHPASIVKQRGLKGLVSGIACVLVAVSVLAALALMYLRRPVACSSTTGCQAVAIAALALGLVGVVVLVRGVTNPTRR
jgi:hypothetical protein